MTAPERPRVAIAGAGFGGIGLALTLARAGNRNFTIFERAPGIGGTWRENTYPGAGCDVPSHLYSFSFEPKWNWTRAYAEQPEILDYLEHCVDKYRLRPHLRLGVAVKRAAYDEARRVWTLALSDGTSHEADVFVAACGQLNHPVFPSIPGREEFAGISFHSARWRHDVPLEGKRVAVIGTGASAVQFVPRIAPVVDSLALYQRSAPYIIPKADRAYGAWEKRLFRAVPFVQALNRARKYVEHESRFLAFSAFKPAMLVSKLQFRNLLASQVSDPKLRERLTPDYAMGCKRVMIASDYYPALARPNVEVVSDPIERISAKGVVTAGGRERPCDVIVYATGFAASDLLVPMQVSGRGGRELADSWRDGAHAYLGLVVHGFPNFFMLYGPNTNLGHNSIIFMLEAQFRYVTSCLRALERRENSRVEVRSDVESRFNARLQEQLAATVWADGCTSWYLDARGRNVNNWPRFTFEYARRTRAYDPRDFEPATAL